MGLKMDARTAQASAFSQESHEPVTDGILGLDIQTDSVGPSAERGISAVVFQAGPGPVVTILNAADIQPARKAT